jgi:hypothetical protein
MQYIQKSFSIYHTMQIETTCSNKPIAYIFMEVADSSRFLKIIVTTTTTSSTVRA